MKPSDSVASIRGVLKKHRTVLEVMNIRTVRDLLFHFPFRYEDYTEAKTLADAEPDTEVAVEARIESLRSRHSFRSRLAVTEAQITDGHGTVTAIWFNQPYLTKYLRNGGTYRFAGKIKRTKYGLRLQNPLYGSPDGDSRLVNPLMPVYPLTAGLNQHALRRIIRKGLDAVGGLADHLPEELREGSGLLGLADAVRWVHFPETAEQRDRARRRLAFDELLRVQLAMGRTRRFRDSRTAPAVPFDEAAVRDFVSSLPFTLTGDQKRAAWEIIRDMERETPMHRLLDGDVGSGKTAVAAVAAVSAANAGRQAAIMAPTEILAQQHYLTLSKMFGRRVRLALWTNSYKRLWSGGRDYERKGKKETEGLAARIAKGEVQVVVGTHALVERAVEFGNLALVVIDEQHRFGVRTRKLLKEKGEGNGLEPHLLSMTATPIPRSLALTAYGDLDLSVLKEKPGGRKPIRTRVVPPKEKPDAYEFVRRELQAGRQAFFVCPLIDPSDILGVSSVTEQYERLSEDVFPEFRVAVLHGKLKATEKEAVMDDFKAKKTHLLVSTSVVEVGVDVPNATVMCIEGADRFGLAQLHQFRGRVGRGEHQSHCLLFPAAYGHAVRDRLKAMEATDDGFALAEKDLNMRGPGDILGETQSGHVPNMQLASITDMELVRDARQAAQEILDVDPDLNGSPALRDFVGDSVEAAHLE